MKIYTRTGDKGETSLRSGTRVSKNDIRIEALGAIDELNSAIGLSIAFLEEKKHLKIKKELTRIQKDLLQIGSALAFPAFQAITGLDKRVTEFEKLIDTLTEEMPELKNFILPGGGAGGASLHVCRAITRRVERRVVVLSEKESIDKNIIIYLNRFSDLLFTMARFVNFKEKKKEVVWQSLGLATPRN